MTRREFAKGAAGAAAGILAPAAVAAAGKAAAQTSDLHWATATELRDRIARKDVSLTEVVQHLLGRADALDGTLHVYATLDRAGALEQARSADAAIARREKLGPLHCVPIPINAHIPVMGLNCHPLSYKPSP